VGLGGRVAEELTMGEITTGAENDLQEVTKLAREMVTRWGMSPRLGSVFLGSQPEVFLGREVGLRERQAYSEQTATLIDEEMRRLIGERYRAVHDLLSGHREELERLAQALLEREVLDDSHLPRLMQNARDTEETSSARAVSAPSSQAAEGGQSVDHSSGPGAGQGPGRRSRTLSPPSWTIWGLPISSWGAFTCPPPFRWMAEECRARF
jgi:cell division protease FtsH